MVERSLQTKGFEVLAASSGTEAMERIGGAMPDLVVCDVVMPDIDGYRICEFVRAHPALGSTPVLLISGIVNASVLERAAHVRSNAVLRKPFTADVLAVVLRDATALGKLRYYVKKILPDMLRAI